MYSTPEDRETLYRQKMEEAKHLARLHEPWGHIRAIIQDANWAGSKLLIAVQDALLGYVDKELGYTPPPEKKE